MIELISKEVALDSIWKSNLGDHYAYKLAAETICDVPIVATILDETDLIEIEHRFGKWVRFVIEDMLAGKEERYKENVEKFYSQAVGNRCIE